MTELTFHKYLSKKSSLEAVYSHGLRTHIPDAVYNEWIRFPTFAYIGTDPEGTVVSFAIMRRIGRRGGNKNFKTFILDFVWTGDLFRRRGFGSRLMDFIKGTHTDALILIEEQHDLVVSAFIRKNGATFVKNDRSQYYTIST